MEMLMKNPSVSYRLFGFRRPLSSRFGVAHLDICPNVVDSIDKPEGLASASLAATCNYTITLATGGHSHDFGTNRASIPTATYLKESYTGLVLFSKGQRPW